MAPLNIDKRASERLSLELPLTYAITTPHGKLQGTTTTTNLSGQGLQFLVPERIAQKTPCNITLTLPNKEKPITFEGQVRWCKQKREKKKSMFEAGITIATDTQLDKSVFTRYCHFIASQLLQIYLR